MKNDSWEKIDKLDKPSKTDEKSAPVTIKKTKQTKKTPEKSGRRKPLADTSGNLLQSEQLSGIATHTPSSRRCQLVPPSTPPPCPLGWPCLDSTGEAGPCVSTHPGAHRGHMPGPSRDSGAGSQGRGHGSCQRPALVTRARAALGQGRGRAARGFLLRWCSSLLPAPLSLPGAPEALRTP